MAKRKRPRGPQRSRRRQPRREPYDRVLVVCEGTKTEPDYFREIVEAYRLSSANVVVASGRGSDPESVVATAVERYEDDPDYEGVYVVVDRDTHAGYAAAEDRVRNAPGGLRDVARLVPSTPCFEYWLLLPFEETARPYAKTGKRSPCANVIRDLEAHLPGYSKGGGGTFAATREYVEEAKARAARRLVEARRAGTENPTTHVHVLVERLQTLRDGPSGTEERG